MSLYDNDGKIRTTTVAGSSWTGIYASDGSINIVIDDATSRGAYHSCGALRVNSALGTTSAYDLTGAFYYNFFLGRGTASVVSSSNPNAPSLTWNSTSADSTPDFLIDLPNGWGDYRDAAAGDHLIIERQLQAGGAWTQYLDRTLISGDITDDTISATGLSAVPTGDYYFRARITRGALIGTNSANVAVTIAASAATNRISSAGNNRISAAGNNRIAAA